MAKYDLLCPLLEKKGAFLISYVSNKKKHTERNSRMDLPQKPLCDGLVKAVMVGEGDAVVDAEHQEEQGAADKQIPSTRPAQMRRLQSPHANWCGGWEQAEAPDRFTEESFSPPPPSASPQRALRRWANQSEEAGTPASSKKLLVKDSSHNHEAKEQGRKPTEWSHSITFSRWERLSKWGSLWLQCCEAAASNPLLHKELQKSALFLRQRETATAAVTTWMTGRKISYASVLKVCSIIILVNFRKTLCIRTRKYTYTFIDILFI